jgi:DUF971 family protein
MLTDMIRAASDGPPMDSAATPEQIVLAADRASLRLVWAGGEQAEISAEPLRAACRCAWCTRDHIDGNFPGSFDCITIERVSPIGDYAINMAFSDGHGRGIYPWVYLRKLALSPVAKVRRGAEKSTELLNGSSA